MVMICSAKAYCCPEEIIYGTFDNLRMPPLTEVVLLFYTDMRSVGSEVAEFIGITQVYVCPYVC